MGIASHGLSSDNAPGLFCFAITGLTVVLAQIAAAPCCRKRFPTFKFYLWLAVYTLLFIFLGLLIYLGIVMVFEEEMRENLAEIVPQLLLMTVVFGAILYVIQLPFVILGHRNHFYRERFTALLGIKMTKKAAEQSDEEIQAKPPEAIE